jgi:hypothetical protein
MKKKLTQDVFFGQPPEVVVACVDFDGLLKFGDSENVRYTWASERWRGANWINEVPSLYEPLTLIHREEGGDNCRLGPKEIALNI